MKTKKSLSVALILGIGLAVFLVVSGRAIVAGQAGGGAVAIDNDDIGGVVTGARGPEAGVWVIAETRNLPTRLIKTVVTDDQGRYLSCPTCRRRTTTSGFVATGSWTRRRSSRRPARSST